MQSVVNFSCVSLTTFGDSTPSRSFVIRPRMAAYCRPEVAGDVISGQRAFEVEVVPLTKFGDPNSNRLVTIQKAAGRQTDGQTDMLVRRAHLMHCALHASRQWAKNDLYCHGPVCCLLLTVTLGIPAKRC